MTVITEPSAPLVSMVIPVYNSVSYLAETLDSMLVQGLSDTELEVIMVNDGSNDGTERMVDEYAARYSNFRAIHQAQSGGPASPCNVGAYAARGRYFFVLGSDDVMTPNALRDLAGIAEREESDVVLGKLGSIGGRRTPGAVFAKTVYDADLVENRIFNTLSAVKLFRTELLHKTGALHPTTLRIGSDQPFVAALYLAANKISICADREFVLIRTREDGTNITSTRRSPRDYMDLLNYLIPVIVNGAEPGAQLDGVMRRPFRNTVTKVLKTTFLELDEATQLRILDELGDIVGPVFNETTAAHLEPLPRTKAELALNGDLDSLLALMAWEKAGGASQVMHNGSRFTYAFPDDLAAQLGKRYIHPPVVKGDATLMSISGHGSTIDIRIRALVLNCKTPASAALLRLQNRATGHKVDVETTVERPMEVGSGSGYDVTAQIDLSEFALGVWDAYVVQRFGSDEVVNRFGGKKSGTVATDPIYIFSSDEDAHVLGKLYYTQGFENLSIDLGFTHTKNELPEASVQGVVQQSDGSELAIMSVTSDGAVEFLIGTETEGGPKRSSAPHLELGNSLFCVVLPRGYPRSGPARSLVIQGRKQERTITLPRPSSVVGGAPSDELMKWRDGERAGDILRQAVGDLGVVGRRSARRAGQEMKSLTQRIRGSRSQK